MKFGKAIESLRKRFEMNRKELADAIGKSPSFITLIEQDLREPSMTTIKEICDFFDIPVSVFLYEAIKHDESVKIQKDNPLIQTLESTLEEYVNSIRKSGFR